MEALIGFDQRGEQGITHLLFLVGGIGVLFVVIFAGYFVFNQGNKKDPTTSGSDTAFSRCLSANNNDNRICNFEKNYLPINDASYTSTVNVTSPQGTVSNLTYSSDGKGNSAVSGTSDGQQLSSIVLDGNTYVKVTGSGWIEYSSSAADAPAQINPTASMNIAVGQSSLTFQYLGTMACGSLSCYKYSVGESSQPDVSQVIGFDKTSYKLRTWTYQGDTGSTNMTIEYEPVTIAAPSPISAVR